MKVDLSSRDLRLISQCLQIVETQIIESIALSSLKSESVPIDHVVLQKRLKELSDRCFYYYSKSVLKEDPRA